jgi:hypothetical protein
MQAVRGDEHRSDRELPSRILATIKAELPKWAGLTRAAGIKIDPPRAAERYIRRSLSSSNIQKPIGLTKIGGIAPT